MCSKLISRSAVLQVGNSVYYNYVLSVNGKAEQHGSNYEKDYLTKLIVSTFLCTVFRDHAVHFFVLCLSVFFRHGRKKSSYGLSKYILC